MPVPQDHFLKLIWIVHQVLITYKEMIDDLPWDRVDQPYQSSRIEDMMKELRQLQTDLKGGYQ